MAQAVKVVPGGAPGLITPFYEGPTYSGDGQAGSSGNGGNGANGGNGGDGGNGGNGGTVAVSNVQALQTTGLSYASGILAQSFGAIGGVGGAVGIAGVGGLGYVDTGSPHTYCLGVGSIVKTDPFVISDCVIHYGSLTVPPGTNGTAGAAGLTAGMASFVAGNGGLVQVTNSGAIATQGSYSDGITAISAGGLVGLPGVNSNRLLWDGPTLNAQDSSAAAAIINSSAGAITTQGHHAIGLNALSLGVGSGSAGAVTVGNGTSLLIPGSAISTQGVYAYGISAVSQTYAGAASLTGSAKDVSVTNWGAITTASDNAIGINALSKGVGSSASGTAPVQAGAVTVVNGASIATRGHDATGINAVSMTYAGTGSRGSASNVNVTNSGVITTQGRTTVSSTAVDNTAAGIFARSYALNGNSGGVTISNSNSVATAGLNAHAIMATTAAPSGNTGAISITATGANSIATSGASASAIYAKTSASGTAGAIDINIAAPVTVSASADSTTTILTSAIGGSSAGNISITSAGTIRAGTNSTAIAVEGGANNTIVNTGLIEAGVGGRGIDMFNGGGNNTITNTGTIKTGDIFDYVIRTDNVGTLVINNNAGGLIVGSIDPGTITLNNAFGATYLSGKEINLGIASDPLNTFYNSGVFSPGDIGAVMSPGIPANGRVELTGNYNQSATGNYIVGFQYIPNVTGVAKANLADQVHVTGTATLAGLVTIADVSSGGGPQPGTRSTLIMYADGGLTSTATLNPLMLVGSGTGPSTTAVFRPSLSTSALADPTLSQVAPYPVTPGNGLYLNYSVDYNPAGLTPNQSSVGAAVNLIQAYGAPAYQPVAQALLLAPDVKTLGDIYDLLSGEGTIASQQATFTAQSAFSGAVLDHAGQNLDCDEREPACRKRWHVWSQSTFNRSDLSGTYNEAASSTTFGSLTLGADYKADANIVLGFAIGGMSPSFSVPGRQATGGSTGASLALYAMARSDFGTYAKGMGNFGVMNNWVRRMAYRTAVQGSFMSQTWGGTLEVGQRIGGKSFSITPFGGMQITRLHQDAYSESDSVWGNYFFSHHQNSAPVFAGLQMNASFVAENGMSYAPSVRAQWVRETDRNRWVKAESLAARGFPWEVAGTKAPKDVLKIDGGVTVGLTDAMKFRGSYTSDVSRQTRSHGLSLRGDVTF